MNGNLFKYLILVTLMLLIEGSFFISSAKAESGLILETTKECDIQYSGDSCIAELKLTNSTGKILDGEVFLHIDYQGLCSNNELRDFDGKGIEVQFSIADNSWLNFSDDWENGMTTVSGFSIPKDETQPKLKIETVPNLCPGEYTFTLKLKGTAEEKEYVTPPVVIGGRGGGSYYIPPTTSEEGEVITLTNPDGGKVELFVPAGAAPKNTHFTIERVDISSTIQPDSESGIFLIAGLLCEIKAQRDGEFITTFDKPLTLTFTYTDEQIKELDEDSLKIYWRNDEKWAALENSELNIDNNTVTASIDHFTLFSLMGLKTVHSEGEEEKEIREGKEKKEEFMISEEEEKEKKEEEVLPGGESEKGKDISAISKEKEEKENKKEEEVSAGTPQRGLSSMMASIGMIWRRVSKSTFLILVVVLCVMGLILISLKEWRLFRRKRLFWRKRKK